MQNMARLGWRAGLAALLALGIAGCGGGSDKSAAASYSAVVSFGDSLSDPGAYKVGPIAEAGGGLFTVNGIVGAVGSDPTPSYTWAQLVAAAVVGTPSCAARTGGFGIEITSVPGCTNYAQGGSRVRNPIGTGHADGALTEPVVMQIENYLSRTANNKFTGTELVTIQGGANELFAQADNLTLGAQTEGNRVFGNTLVGLLAKGASNPAAAALAIGLAMGAEATKSESNPTSIVTAAVTAAILETNDQSLASPEVLGPMVATATTAGTTAGAQYAMTTGAFNATEAMRNAAEDLSVIVKSMLNNGAKRIVVTNLPDVSQTPYALGTITVTAGVADNSTQQLILAMTSAFNEKLKTELSGLSGVLFVDVFTENQKQIANKAQFGLTNVTDTACQGRSLVCNALNLIPGDTSRYLFADGVHPTPYGHKLLAQLINKELVLAGWL
jgi:phospholipase/lecithinase/hemolysin